MVNESSPYSPGTHSVIEELDKDHNTAGQCVTGSMWCSGSILLGRSTDSGLDGSDICLSLQERRRTQMKKLAKCSGREERKRPGGEKRFRELLII